MSTVHRPVVIDDATGRPRAAVRRQAHAYEIFEFWPSDLQQVFVQAGIRADGRPRMRTVATRAGRGRSAAHHASLRGSTYAMRVKSTETRIAFNATADASAHALYWFVNDAFVGAVCRAMRCSGSRGRQAVIRCGWSTITGAAIARWRWGWSSRRCICIRIARSWSAYRDRCVVAAKTRVSEHQQVDDDDGDRRDDHPVHADAGHQYTGDIRKSEQAREVGDREDLRAC